MPEQHRVGDRTEEGCTDECAQNRHERVAPGIERSCHQADDAEHDGHQIEDRWELGASFADLAAAVVDPAVDTGHRRHSCRATVVLGPLTAHPGATTNDRHAERDGGGDDEPHGRGLTDEHRLERQTCPQRACGQEQIGQAQHPAVPQPDLTPTGRVPAEQHASRRPLQEHGRGVEADHGYRRYVSSPHDATSPADRQRAARAGRPA